MSQFSIDFFSTIFRKKGLNSSKLKECVWWIWANLRWIDNFWEKKSEKIWRFFLAIFRKKSLKCSELKESVHYDEFEPIWDELIIFEKKIWKNLNFFFFSYTQKKSLNCSELKQSVHYDEFEHIWDELMIFEEKIWKNLKKIS